MQENSVGKGERIDGRSVLDVCCRWMNRGPGNALLPRDDRNLAEKIGGETRRTSLSKKQHEGVTKGGGREWVPQTCWCKERGGERRGGEYIW